MMINEEENRAFILSVKEDAGLTSNLPNGSVTHMMGGLYQWGGT